MAVWNPLKKDYWTKDNLTNKEMRDAMTAASKEKVATKEEKVKNDGWEHCPRCESNRVKQLSKSYMVFMLWLAGILFLLVGIIIWPLLIFSVIFILLCPLGYLMPKMNKCKDCNYMWTAKKKKK